MLSLHGFYPVQKILFFMIYTLPRRHGWQTIVSTCVCRPQTYSEPAVLNPVSLFNNWERWSFFSLKCALLSQSFSIGDTSTPFQGSFSFIESKGSWTTWYDWHLSFNFAWLLAEFQGSIIKSLPYVPYPIPTFSRKLRIFILSNATENISALSFSCAFFLVGEYRNLKQYATKDFKGIGRG